MEYCVLFPHDLTCQISGWLFIGLLMAAVVAIAGHLCVRWLRYKDH